MNGRVRTVDAELKEGFKVRLVFLPILGYLLYRFRLQLPFAYPHMLYLTLASALVTILGVAVYVHGRFRDELHSAFPHVDAFFFLPGLLFTGGFMSPIVPLMMVTIWGTPILYPTRKNLGASIFAIIVFEYVLVSALQFFHGYDDPVSYSRQLVEEKPFFLYTFTLAFMSMTFGFAVTKKLHAGLHERADRGALLIQKMVAGTSTQVGEKFFPALVQNLTEVLGTREAYVGREEGGGFRILAQTLDGEPLPAAGAAEPRARGGEAGEEVELRAPNGKKVGRLGVSGISRTMDRMDVRGVLQVFGSRAAAELLRQASEENRRQLERALADSQRMEALGRLAKGISHQFNNLFAAVTGYSSLIKLKHAKRNPELRRKAEVILSASQRGGELIRQLRSFVKQGNYTMDVVRLPQVFRQAVEILRVSLDKRIEVNTFEEAQNIHVLADAGEIEATLVNLVLNAASGIEGRGRLELRTFNIVLEVGHGGLGPREFFGLSVSAEGPAAGHRSGTGPSGLGEELGRELEEAELEMAGIYSCIQNHGGHVALDRAVRGARKMTIYLPCLGPRSIPEPKQDALKDQA